MARGTIVITESTKTTIEEDAAGIFWQDFSSTSYCVSYCFSVLLDVLFGDVIGAGDVGQRARLLTFGKTQVSRTISSLKQISDNLSNRHW